MGGEKIPVEKNQIEQNQITILIVEDHPVTRYGLAYWLAAIPDFRVVGTAGCCKDAENALESLHPAVVVLDMALPDGKGTRILDFIHNRKLPSKVVVLSAYAESGLIREAISAGANGYVLKGDEMIELAQAIRVADMGGIRLSPGAARSLAEGRDGSELSQREDEILVQLAKGWSNRKIAEELDIEIRTVRFHLENIYMKLGVGNRGEAMAWVLKNRAG